MRPLSLLASFVLAATIAVAGQPAVGDKAPAFTLKSLRGKSVTLSEQTSAGPVALIVLRGFPGYQCPVCNRQVQEFLKRAPEFSKAGTRVVMVYPGPAKDLEAKAEEFASGKSFPDNFELLLDPDYVMTEAYGLRWDAKGETAYPSTFLIDTSGAIVFAKISNSHGGRSTPSEVLEASAKGK